MTTPARRWVKRHPFLVGFAALGLVISLALLVILGAVFELRDTQAALTQLTIRTQLDRCESANLSREAIQFILDRLANPSDDMVGTVDFAAVEGYSQLDPATQDFLSNLADATENSSQSAAFLTNLAEEFRESNGPIDCDKVEADLEEELRATYRH